MRPLLRLVDQAGQDLRYALRGLRRSPGFTMTVVATLALGIGANTAMFSVVDRLMFRPLSYLREPESVHRIYWRSQDRGRAVTSLSTNYTRYLDLARWTTSFDQLAGFSERDVAVGEGDAARERRIGAVSGSFFAFFDARPALGRFFGPADDLTPRGADVAVLSHGFWQAEFGGRDVLGLPLQVGNVRATIIGVAPPDFHGVNDANPPAVYLPITTFAGSTGTDDAKTYFTRYRWGWMHVMVRRKPGVTLAAAQSDASVAYRRSFEAARADEPSLPALEAARPEALVSSIRPGAGPDPSLEARTALWLMIVAGVVLLIAAANVANLVLARTLHRRRETAVRIALGVSRARLIRQTVTETLILALAGGVAALLVAQSAGTLVRSMLIAAAAPVSVFTDGRPLLVTLGLAVVVGLLVGLVPAVVADRGDLVRTLRGGARGGTAEGARIRAGLPIFQGALSVALLVGAGLFVRSLSAVTALPMGYDADRVLLVNRVLRGPWPGDSAVRSIRDVLLSTAETLPGVESAAWVNSAPFVSTSNTDLFVAGIDSVRRLGVFTYQATTSDYFRTMGTRILHGRGLQRDDRFGAPNVVVVSESMARVLWPGQNALGQCLRVRENTAPCTTVVGVAEDMVQRDLAGAQRYHFYLAIDQYRRTSGNGLLLRLRGDPAIEGEAIRASLQRAMPGSSYLTAVPLRTIVQDARRSWRLGATMFAVFGGLALVVAAVGLYGVIGYGVSQRTHELGVRIALGAERPAIVRLVAGQGVRLALAGVGIGLATALAASRWIQPLLFRQSATDPVVYGTVAAIMVAVAVVASGVPALRAARSDPNAALRSE